MYPDFDTDFHPCQASVYGTTQRSSLTGLISLGEANYIDVPADRQLDAYLSLQICTLLPTQSTRLCYMSIPYR